MTLEDRDIWNERYSKGAYADRNHPSEVLRNWISLLPSGRALDVACGTGRNTRFLAENGYQVIGIDISDVAIDRAKQRECEGSTSVEYRLHDLDDGLPLLGRFNLITMIRFLDRSIIANVDQHLHSDGCALFEFHMKHDSYETLAGPRTDRFRVESGEVQSLLSHMEVLREFEGLVVDPDGRSSAIVRVLAKKS